MRLPDERHPSETDPHGVAHAKCRLCNYRCVSVFPEGTDSDNMECANCGRMTLEVENEEDGA
jgi:hypothetical protein